MPRFFSSLRGDKKDTNTETTETTETTQTSLQPDTADNQAKPRKKSFLERWQDLTNPPAEFSEEDVKRITGMTKAEFSEWLKDPKNVETARKNYPSSLYWAFM